MVDMLACHLQLKMKIKFEFPLLMHRFFMKIKHLALLPTINLPAVEFIHILTAFYHMPLKFSHSFIDASEYTQVGLNCTPN